MPIAFENIRRVASDFGRSTVSPEAARNLSFGVAEALHWTTGADGLLPTQVDLGPMQVTRGFIGPQPAAIFSAATDSNNGGGLNDAALYAYHASIEWGLVATKDAAIIFNSHWVRQNDWFHLPPIPWNEFEQNRDIFEALTPVGITEGRIEKIATKIYKPDRFLRSVDDALVERLDFWRDETLRYSRNVKDVDENLQALFAQLFILRTVEDRKLAPMMHPLRSICSVSGEVNIVGLRQLLNEAQVTIGGELFEVDALEYIPNNVLGGIINDLYTPHNLPHNTSRYNFAWIDADVLGLAYEKYLSTVLTPLALPPQLSLFEQPNREVGRISVRKSGGVYYTPNYLVQYLTEHALDQLDNSFGPDHLPRIADFACGSGSFLVAATDSLIRRLRQQDSNRNWARELVTGKHIVGIDIDERAVTIARLALWLRFAEEPNPLPLPHLTEIIVQGDSLSNEVWNTIPQTYDIILGNPPFLATGRTPSREELSAKFKTAQGRYDYSYLFIELALDRLNPSGTLGMVVPNRLFRNRDANTIREVLTENANLLTIVDFGSNQVFEKTSAYIGSIVAQKIESNVGNQVEMVRAINVISLSSEFLAALLINASKIEDELKDETIVAYSVPHPRGNKPWLLVSPSARRSRTRLEDESEQLSTIAGIYQGIRTGANDIFIVEIESGGEGPLAKILNGLGDYGVVETALLHPVAFGSDIQKYDAITSQRYLIYPYRNNIAISEPELQENYPRMLEYLLRYRDILADRSSIEAGGLRWYELVRKRAESWLGSPKLVIRDLATETSFAIDESGSTYLVGGTAVVPADPDILLALLAYLNSSVVNEYIRQLTPSFRGGFQKFEPQHLQRVPVLTKLLTDSEFTDRLAEQASRIIYAKVANRKDEQDEAEKVVEQLLREATGLGEQELL